MAGKKPVSQKNLDGYGAAPLAWERARERLENDWRLHGAGDGSEAHTHWLATVRPDGRPHVMPVGAAWHEGSFYIVSGPGTRKSKNLARNPACVIAFSGQDIDLVVEGTAAKVSDPAKLEQLAEVYRSTGWEPTVRDGAFVGPYSAPSAGPPPWEVFEFTPTTVFGLATGDPSGATRWRLE